MKELHYIFEVDEKIYWILEKIKKQKNNKKIKNLKFKFKKLKIKKFK